MPKFTNRQDAQKQLRRLAFLKPTNDMGSRSITFAKFG